MTMQAAAPGDLKSLGAPITSRTYVHLACKTETTISGEDFTLLCNPDRHLAGTICVHCDTGAAFSEFEWADTGENVEVYRRRLRTMIPMPWRLMRVIVAPVAGIALMIALPLLLNALGVPSKVVTLAIPVCFFSAYFAIRIWAAGKWRPDWRRVR